MALDSYAPCPCGSGKKFKWCCQPIHEDVAKAMRLENEGQHEAALRAMDEVVAKHPTNPEAWGRKAQLLYLQQRSTTRKPPCRRRSNRTRAMRSAIICRAGFATSKVKSPGPCILFRRAAEYYPAEATAILADIYGLIFDCEFKLNRPVAARAALEMAIRLDPTQ